jgi:DNA polymerase III subunit delta'
MAFHELAGNEQVRDALLRTLAQNRLPHSLVFAGPDGVGKRQFALAVAQALNCPVKPLHGCGECSVCARIARREHPDVEVVAPDGQFIKVAQMRDAIQKLGFQPFEGKKRVTVFDAAERMNVNAANALLKMLEEPPAHVVLILLTASPSAMLETIRSRCQMMRFTPLPTEAMERFLDAAYRRPVEDNRLLARVAQGRPGRVHGVDVSEYRARRKEVLELVELLGRRTRRVRLLRAAAHFGKKERAEFEEFLDLTASVLRDVLCAAIGADEEAFAHGDVRPKIVEIAAGYDAVRVSALLEGFEAVRRDLGRNVNRTLALEALFVGFIARA